MTVKVL